LVRRKRFAAVCMSRQVFARLLHAAPPADLGALFGDFRALVLHGASNADTAATVGQICRSLRGLSVTEMEILEQAAQGMPAGPMPADSAAAGTAVEDEDADPVGAAPKSIPACSGAAVVGLG
jgi:hypothetical protein